jgi:hypothetical protein
MGFWGRSGSRGRGLGLKMEAETGGGQGDERETMLHEELRDQIYVYIDASRDQIGRLRSTVQE